MANPSPVTVVPQRRVPGPLPCQGPWCAALRAGRVDGLDRSAKGCDAQRGGGGRSPEGRCRDCRLSVVAGRRLRRASHVSCASVPGAESSSRGGRSSWANWVVSGRRFWRLGSPQSKRATDCTRGRECQRERADRQPFAAGMAEADATVSRGAVRLERRHRCAIGVVSDDRWLAIAIVAYAQRRRPGADDR